MIVFPRPGSTPSGLDEAGSAALAEIDAAIALVLVQAARRVRLTAIPFIESISSVGLAHARAAGLAFALERGERAGVVTVTIGPAETPRQATPRRT